MSKRHKGKQCVYCATARSTTGDHVVRRNFFLENQRGNLPTAPACWSCNHKKSRLEHYLMTVLPFGARHPDAVANLITLVPKRLGKNSRLLAELASGYAKSGGSTIPLDHVKLEMLFAMIAQGLLWHHWQTALGNGYSSKASIFSLAGERFFKQMLLHWNPTNRVTVSLGENTFSYEGFQANDCPKTTIWTFSMYGGIGFLDPKVPIPASLAVAVTGSNVLIEQFGNLRSPIKD
jgi:hypothetical protein